MSKLLIIANDKIQDYVDKGNSEQERRNYFNPNGFFNHVAGLSWKESKRFEYTGMKIYPLNLGISKKEIFKIEGDKEEFNRLIKKNKKSICEVIYKIKPDLVRGYNGQWAAALSGLIGNEFSIPSLTSVHDAYSTNKSILDVDRIICVSDTVREHCINIVGEEYNNKMDVVLNGINLDVFCKRNDIAEIKRRFNSNHKLISVGRFCKEKNLEKLVEAVNLVKNEFPDLIHLHFGSGELKKSISNLIDTLKLKDTIYLMDNTSQEELAKYYSWADVFMFPSLTEGLPNVLAEAMACGCNIVTSDLPPMNKMITAGVNGLLINPLDIHDIKEKTAYLLQNIELREKLRNNAVEESKKYDSNKKKVGEIKIYKEMLGMDNTN